LLPAWSAQFSTGHPGRLVLFAPFTLYIGSSSAGPGVRSIAS
jgi:hypothetical protein